MDIPFGNYKNLIMVKDWDPQESDETEYVYYAKGIGYIYALVS